MALLDETTGVMLHSTLTFSIETTMTGTLVQKELGVDNYTVPATITVRYVVETTW